MTRLFRRAALPLGWYYFVTLALPLANGAGRSDVAVVKHALVVLVVPPLLILCAYAAQKIPSCRARIAACVRSRTSSFVRMFVT